MSKKNIPGCSDRLRAERRRLELSQEQLAKAGGITRNTQWNYEASAFNPKARYLSKIAGTGVDIYYVLTGERKEPLPGELDPEFVRLVDVYQRLERIDRGVLFRMAWAFSRVLMK